MRGILSAFGKLGVVALIAVAFAFGLLLTVYLSLRSPSIQVPDVVNKTYLDGEATLGQARLDIRERAQRYKPNVQPGIILDQSPRAGEVVKAGQTVAVVVSRAPKEGERPPDDEVAEERREEESRGTRTSNENAGKNENRERRRPSNRNSNASGNQEGNGNRNATANTRNANSGNSNLSGNRNANRAANTNLNANRSRNSNSGAARNTNTSRPANANRRPNP